MIERNEELHEGEEQVLAELLEGTNVRDGPVGRQHLFDVDRLHDGLHFVEEHRHGAQRDAWVAVVAREFDHWVSIEQTWTSTLLGERGCPACSASIISALQVLDFFASCLIGPGRNYKLVVHTVAVDDFADDNLLLCVDLAKNLVAIIMPRSAGIVKYHFLLYDLF